MALDAHTRHALHLRLDELVGPELAAAMMTAYPPFDWSQVALKSDLQAMEDRLVGVLHREIHQAITSQTRTLFVGFVSTIVAVVGAMVGLVALTG